MPIKIGSILDNYLIECLVHRSIDAVKQTFDTFEQQSQQSAASVVD